MMHARNIKNTKAVADRSGAGVKLYYSIVDNAVYTEDQIGRYHVTISSGRTQKKKSLVQ